jgi:translation initiation factor IF-2
VAVVRFKDGVAVGDELCFEGPSSSFSQTLKSMQYEHESINKVKKGQEVGVKVKKPVREGHKVYRV